MFSRVMIEDRYIGEDVLEVSSRRAMATSAERRKWQFAMSRGTSTQASLDRLSRDP